MRKLAIFTVLMAGFGCGEDQQQGTIGTRVIAATGGTVTAGGATLTIPAGALSEDTTITVTISAPSSSVPDSSTVKGSIFDFGPDGTTFSTPATLSLPMTATPTANESAVLSFLDPVANQWVDLTSTVTGAQISAPVSHFTGFAARVPVERIPGPTRKWDFVLESYQESFLLPPPEGNGTQVGGDNMYHHHDFGENIFGIDDDGFANLEAYSSASGITFWVSADAPLEGSNNTNGDAVIISRSTLSQSQSFIKHAANDSLRFVVTEATLAALDKNGVVLSPLECQFAHLPDAENQCRFVMEAQAALKCEIYFQNRIIAPVAGVATLAGWAEHFIFYTSAVTDAKPLWTDDTFDFDGDTDGDGGSHARAALKAGLTVDMDLSSIPEEKEFTLACTLIAAAANVRGRESGIGAYLRDPQKTGGTTIETTGLEATNNPVLTRPPPEPPPVCMSGPDPAAGVLQFSSATYAMLEKPFSVENIIVTRTQGSTGAVSATFTTSDGTALAGSDYTSNTTTVHFADGDTVPRVVPLTILLDGVEEPDKTVTLTLSQPGGCATLGPQSSAVVTILDDDAPVSLPTLFTVGGTVSGLIGTGLVLENHTGLFLEIFGNGPFTFSSLPTPSGMPYFVRVFNQPHGPSQTCTVTNGTGVFTDHDVTNVLVTCVGQ